MEKGFGDTSLRYLHRRSLVVPMSIAPIVNTIKISGSRVPIDFLSHSMGSDPSGRFFQELGPSFGL